MVFKRCKEQINLKYIMNRILPTSSCVKFLSRKFIFRDNLCSSSKSINHSPQNNIIILRSCERIYSTDTCNISEKQQTLGDNGRRISEKIKNFFKKYGLPGIFVHFSIYFLTLGGLYLAVEKEKIRVVDVELWLRKLGLDRYIDLEKLGEKKKATNFAVAWVLAKPTEPIRFVITVAITPYFVRILKLLK